MKRASKWIVAALVMVLLATTVLASSGQLEKTVYYQDIKITIGGEEITPTDVSGKSTEPFLMENSVYVPVRAISETLGYDVAWDGETNTVSLTNSFIAAVTAYDAENDLVYVLTEGDLIQRIFQVEEDAEIVAGNVYEFSDSDHDMRYDAAKHLAQGPNEEYETGWQQDAVIAYVGYKEDDPAARNVSTYSPAEGYLTFFYGVNGSETRSMDASQAKILDVTGNEIDDLSELDDIMFCTVHVVNEDGTQYGGGTIDYIIVTNTEHAEESFHTLSILFAEGDDMPSAQMKYFYGDDGFDGYGLWAKGKLSKAGYSIYSGSLQGDDLSSPLYSMWKKIEYYQYGRNEDGSIDSSVRNLIATRESYFGLINDHPDVAVEYSYAIVQSAILTEDFVMDYTHLTFADT